MGRTEFAGGIVQVAGLFISKMGDTCEVLLGQNGEFKF